MKILILIVKVTIILSYGSFAFSCQQQSADNFKNHPRLLFKNDNFSTMKKKANSTHKEIWDAIKKYVDSTQIYPPKYPDNKFTLSDYRNYANRLIPYAFMAALSDQDFIKNFAKNYMMTLLSWAQWDVNNNRDLGHAHMLLAVSFAYDWLYQQLSNEERDFVKTKLGLWAEKMYEASAGPREKAWNNWWRKSYMQNHHWINNSALGMAGLALLNEDDRAQKWIDQAREQMTRVQYLLEGINDGSWHEGIHYQSYGLTLSLPFLIALKECQQQNVMPANYLKNYVDWRVYNYLPNTTQPLFNHGDFDPDWGNAYAPQNILRFIASEYKNHKAEWMARQLINIDGRHINEYRVPWYVFEFLYYNPNITPEAPDSSLLTAFFPDFSGVIWRTGWNNDALVFGFKSGALGGRFAFDSFINGEYPWQKPYNKSGCQLNIGHDHNDIHGFYLYSRGNWLVNETAGVNKNETKYHNSILIDGEGQYRPSSGWRDPGSFNGSDGEIIEKFNSANFDFVSSEAKNCYKNIPGILQMQRDILFVRSEYFIIIDKISSLTAHNYQWLGHFNTDFRLENGWIKTNIAKDNAFGIVVLSPADYNLKQGNDGKPFVSIENKDRQKNTEFVMFMKPFNNEKWKSKPDVKLNAENSEGKLINVRYNSAKNSTDQIILNNKDSIRIKIAQYESDAQISLLSYNPQGTLEKLFLYSASFFKDTTTNSAFILSADKKISVDINYEKGEIYFQGSSNTETKIYGPSLKKIWVNGSLIPLTKTGDYVFISD